MWIKSTNTTTETIYLFLKIFYRKQQTQVKGPQQLRVFCQEQKGKESRMVQPERKKRRHDEPRGINKRNGSQHKTGISQRERKTKQDPIQDLLTGEWGRKGNSDIRGHECSCQGRRTRRQRKFHNGNSKLKRNIPKIRENLKKNCMVVPRLSSVKFKLSQDIDCKG
ncbi:hypothetical protein X975_16726, partial [Stegodyphus mimosarum]